MQMRKKSKQQLYKKPAVIFRDVLKTRAGSPLSEPGNKTDPFDPAELFKE